jgi:hypothetical protein
MDVDPGRWPGLGELMALRAVYRPYFVTRCQNRDGLLDRMILCCRIVARDSDNRASPWGVNGDARLASKRLESTC